MNQNQKQKGGSLGLIIIAAIAAINILGIAGLILVIPIIIIGLVFRAISRARFQEADDDNRRMHRAGRRPANEQYPLKNRAVVGNLEEDHRRHMEELDDLLKAGIIEQAEYHERVMQLRNESF